MSILDSICKALNDFSKSMDNLDKEFKEYNRKSEIQKAKREIKNKENLKKIWGK